MGKEWECVIVFNDRALMQWFGGRRLLWAEIIEDHVVSLQLVTTTETAATFNRYGWAILPEDEASIGAIMKTGTPYTQAYKALFPGQFRRYWVEYDAQPQPLGNTRHHARIETIQPARRAILRSDVDSKGNIIEWRLVQGAQAIALEQKLKRLSSQKNQ